MLSKTLKHWLNRFLPDEESIFVLSIIILSSLALIFFGYLFTPFLVSVVIAFIMQGMVRQLKKYRFPHLLAVSVVFIGFITLFFTLLFFIMPILWQQLHHLVNELPKTILALQQELNQILADTSARILPDVVNKFAASLSHIFSSASEYLLAVSLRSIHGLLNVGLYIIVVPIFVFFLLKDAPLFIRQCSQLLPKKRTLLEKIWLEMEEKLANYVRGKAIEIVITVVVTYIAFLILGLNFAELLAIVVGISVVIPYVGIIVATVLVAMAAYLQWGLSPDFWWLMISYSVIHLIEGNVLVPLLFSEAVNLHPIVILLAILVFGHLWGVPGLFFAIPLATLIKVTCLAWPSHESIQKN